MTPTKPDALPPPRRGVSANCRNDHSGPCTGCDCACHHVPPPPNLRQLAGLDRDDAEEDR